MELIFDEKTKGGRYRVYHRERPEAAVDEYFLYLEEDSGEAHLIANEDSPGEAIERLALYKEQSK